MTKRDELYDRMCGLMTEYEEARGETGCLIDECEKYNSFAEDFYYLCLELQRNWETEITYQEG